MKRKALIISNPGEEGQEHYCVGVFKDVRNYESFLTADYGGLWRANEIEKLHRPSVAEVREAVKSLGDVDYGLVIFCGHGWHSISDDSTILALRHDQEIDSAALRAGAEKQTLILDCCRVEHAGPILEEKIIKAFAARSERHPEDCRRYYDEGIRKCGSGLVVMHACAIGERAGDDSEKGGVYSHHLIKGSRDWATNSAVDTSTSYELRSVVAAHDAATPLVVKQRGGRQNPQIEKERTGPYFPFCIVA